MQFESNNDRAVRAREAYKLLAIGRSSFYRQLNADPSFPQGAKIGRARVWLVSDLFMWLKQSSKRRR